MTVHGVLQMGRAVANARMTETVRIGTLTITTVDLDVVQDFDVAYTGPARLSWSTYTVAQPEAAGQPVALSAPVLSIPSGTPGVTVDMRAVVDDSTADEGLIGRVFRIKALPQSGQTTAARYPVEESGETLEEGS